MIVLIVQEEDHRRVFGELDEHVAEAAESVFAKHLDLCAHHLALDELCLRGCEHPVPEERHFLDERSICGDHPAYPVRTRARESA